MNNSVHAIILISCPDSRGLVASVTDFVYKNNGNIEDLDQHVDHAEGVFFMRMEWSLDGFSIARESIAEEFTKIADSYNMDWKLYFTDRPIRTAVFVSKDLHCLYELLYRYRESELNIDIPVIVSNHDDAAKLAGLYGIEYVQFSIDKSNKQEQEQKEIRLMQDKDIELIVLARYMQIISPDFVDSYRNRIINIHHSFLPAFVGAKPYEQAYCRGVKIIGATSHFVTAELDAGPIIGQSVVDVTHKDNVEDMRRKGADLEKLVLSRAVESYADRKVLTYMSGESYKTIVFD